MLQLAFPAGVTSATSEAEPVLALRSLYLAASLCPSFEREIREGAGDWYLSADVALARKNLGTAGLTELRNEIRQMTVKTLAAASPELKAEWHEQIDAIHSWTKGE